MPLRPVAWACPYATDDALWSSWVPPRVRFTDDQAAAVLEVMDRLLTARCHSTVSGSEQAVRRWVQEHPDWALRWPPTVHTPTKEAA